MLVGLIISGLIGWALCYLQACVVMWEMEDVEEQKGGVGVNCNRTACPYNENHDCLKPGEPTIDSEGKCIEAAGRQKELTEEIEQLLKIRK